MSTNPCSEALMPAYFGPESGLYGCGHLAADARRGPALVICQPTGHEYERCHRAMRQLAVQAARRGMSALRFDYHATGDSAGDSEELCLARMRRDIEQAIDYWRDRTGAAAVTLVGIRLGATLAAQLAGSGNAIDALVLYAPVLDGRQLLADWEREQQAFIDKHSVLPRAPAAGDLLGFPLTDALRRELEREFRPEARPTPVRRVLLLADESELDSPLLSEWGESFARDGAAVRIEAVADAAIWRREPMEAIVPIRTIRQILGWLAEAPDA